MIWDLLQVGEDSINKIHIVNMNAPYCAHQDPNFSTQYIKIENKRHLEIFLEQWRHLSPSDLSVYILLGDKA